MSDDNIPHGYLVIDLLHEPRKTFEQSIYLYGRSYLIVRLLDFNLSTKQSFPDWFAWK